MAWATIVKYVIYVRPVLHVTHAIKQTKGNALGGMLGQVHRPVAKVVVALAAIHGLRPTDIAQALLADLDLAAGRLGTSTKPAQPPTPST
jgi:hypothetical protein